MMKNVLENRLVILDHDEFMARLGRVRALMESTGIPSMLVSDNANKYYLTGRVFAGYVYLPLKGEPIFFVKRPVELEGDGVVYIRKPEDMAVTIGLNVTESIGFEFETASYAAIKRLRDIFPTSTPVNASGLLRTARSVKTPVEIEMLRRSGMKHTLVYSRIPGLFRPGMRDIELQVEIERISRLEGCLGQFRISGDTMELHMGNVLAGDNADAPSPYDFAMGGAGSDPSLPVGANGTIIAPGTTVMVDMNGNFDGYMTDMTRVYAPGSEPLAPLALKAHACSIEIHRELCAMMRPGTPCKALWQRAEEIVRDHDLHAYFMGHRQHAGFIGHGVGIEINELPVIAPRSRDIIAEGNVIALEPKFVIPHTGAVGIENTYVVHADSVEYLTTAPEEIVYFEE